MDIFKSKKVNWPLQQSATEQKFRNGLFTVSAEFIRPVGEKGLPSEINTSIGNVAVGDIDPTITTGTNGLEKIQVIGYSIWNNQALEERISLVPMNLEITARTINACGATLIPENKIKTLKVFVENVFQHFPGTILKTPPQLNIFTTNSTTGRLINITGNSFNAKTEFGILSKQYAGDFSPKTISYQTFPQSITRNYYGETITTEVVYVTSNLTIDFGIFDFICPPPPPP